MAGLPDLKFITFGGYDITGLVQGLNDAVTNETEEVDVAGDTILTSRYVGSAAAEVKITGFYDEDLSPAFEAAGAEAVLMYAPLGNGTGLSCECCSAKLLRYERLIEGKALHKAEIDFLGKSSTATGGAVIIDHALMLAPLAARGAAGNTDATDVEAPAQTTDGARLWVAVTALTLGGYTNLTVALRDSADGLSFAAVAGGSTTFTTAGGKMLYVPGTVRKYTSVSWAWTGTGTNPSATFVAALKRL